MNRFQILLSVLTCAHIKRTPAATFARANLEPTTPPKERKGAADDRDPANFTLVEPATRVAGFSKAGPGRHSLPGHQAHIEPSFPDLNNTL